MNTPRKKRRYSEEEVTRLLETRPYQEGFCYLGILNIECARYFARVVSGFVFLEEDMARVFAHLTGCDEGAARHICAVIQSPATRVEIMRAVLERARRNANTPNDFDEIVTEFKEISTLRNHYVHGKWETRTEDDEVLLLRPNEDPYAIGSALAKRFDIEEMQQTDARVFALMGRIEEIIGPGEGLPPHELPAPPNL